MPRLSRAPNNADAPPNSVYRAFWRWHFYAGLLVMPVLMLMALTGGFYLFKTEINGLLYRSLLTVPAQASATPPRAWADAATRAVPGRVVQLTAPADDVGSAQLVVQAENGARRAVYVDPHDARVLGSTTEGGVMAVIQRIHSLDIAGPVFNLLVEVVAGWAIVMVATGVVLWWPRGQSGGVVSVRGPPRRRLFWRDLHAVTGAFAGGIIVFLAATGMPWSAVWGKEVRALVAEAGVGRPAPPGGVDEHAAHGATPAVPWALQEMDIHAGHDMAAMDHQGDGAPELDLDMAVALSDVVGLPRPYTVSIPPGVGKPWSVSHMPAKVEDTRTLYFDSGDGRLLADIGYGDFGAGAKAIEWGIAVHQGQQFGLWNKLVMLAGCVAVWLLGVSALVMWWKRRPKGVLAAPPRPLGRSGYLALAAVVVPLGVIYPLVGASLIAVLGSDMLLRRIFQRAGWLAKAEV